MQNELVKSITSFANGLYRNSEFAIELGCSSQIGPIVRNELQGLVRELVGSKRNIAFSSVKSYGSDKELSEERLYKLVICYGGGTDSTVAAYYATEMMPIDKKDILLLHINYGQEYIEKETTSCQYRQEEGFTVLDLDLRELVGHVPGTDWDYIFPLRNLYLAALASSYGEQVWIVGTVRDENAEGVSDKCLWFYNKCSDIFSKYYGRNILVKSPFDKITRTEEIRLLIDILGKEEATNVLRRTNTCYDKKKLFCGNCKSCYKRYVAMKLNGIEEDYDVHPLSTDLFWDYAIYKEATYGKERFSEVVSVLRDYVENKN